MKKRFLALFLMVVMVLALVTAMAAEEHLLKTEELGEGIPGINGIAFYTMENNNKVYVYCFNSSLLWPTSSDTFATDMYVHDDMLYLSPEVKDKVYRIFYAGFPHNNLGLYNAETDYVLPTEKELTLACDPPQALKNLISDVNWNTIKFTPENVLNAGTERDIFSRIAESLWMEGNDAYFEAAREKPSFVNFVFAWSMSDTVQDLIMYYASFNPPMGDDVAHDSTQVAVWRILNENKVPNNKKEMEFELANYPLAQQLVDFANGNGDYADAYIPKRGITISQMEQYRDVFNTGSQLLREDGSIVGKNGDVEFKEQPNGTYVSEKLHFSDKTYALPYQVSMIDTDLNAEIVSVVNYGSGEFTLTTDYRPTHVAFSIKAEGHFPSDVFQYVHKGQTADNPVYQDMSGVYFDTVRMELPLQAKFIELTGDLKIEKKLAGNDPKENDEFNFKVTLTHSPAITGKHGDLTFTETSATTSEATFTLKGLATGKMAQQGVHYVVATGLPYGADYTVTEADSANRGYETIKFGDTGSIVAKDVQVAEFINTRNVGKLTIHKTVNGNDYDPDAYFTFNITLTDSKGNNINDVFSGVEFKNGQAQVKIKGNDDKVFELAGIPANAKYKVTEVEANQNGYVTTIPSKNADGKPNNSGTISDPETPIVIEFVNTRNTIGNLTVTKHVAGNGADKSQKFWFQVQLSDTNINGTYGQMTFENGYTTFRLGNDETKRAEGLPNGLGYTVTEGNANNNYESQGYIVSGTGEDGVVVGSIDGNETQEVVFTNTRTKGGLTISKHLLGNDTEMLREFPIHIRLTPHTVGEVEYDGVKFKDGLGTVYLAGDQNWVFENLPYGVNYMVFEDSKAHEDGYTVHYSGNTTGTINEGSHAVVVTNTRNTYGSLVVTKRLESEVAEDSKKEFEFHVVLSDKTINGTHGEMHFANGEAFFTLTAGQKKEATNLPNGIEYEVIEKDYTDAGFITEVDGAQGLIKGGSVAEADFVNKKTRALTIVKRVQGNAAEDDREFEIKIALTDENGKPVTGTYDGVHFENGIGTIYLRHNEEKHFVSLRAGWKYVVTETPVVFSQTDKYESNGKDTAGIFDPNAAQVVEFINTRNTYGSLTVKKTLQGNGVQNFSGKEFHFTVVLSDRAINGTFGTGSTAMHFANGVASFTLKGGEQKVATGLPNGIDYEVIETDYTEEGFVTEAEGWKGSIVGNKDMEADFINIRNSVGSLTLTKTLRGNDVEHSREFIFTIYITLDDQHVNGVFSGVTFTNGRATVKLKGGEYKVIEGLPNGTRYTITEAEANLYGYGTVGVDDVGHIDENKATVAEFINTRDTFGDLRVSKLVKDAMNESNREFHFTVELSDKAINGTYGTGETAMHFANGVAGFYLKNKEYKLATGLPNGIDYKVIEQDYTDDGFETTSEKAEGVIVGYKDAHGTVIHSGTTQPEAVFTNTRHAAGSLTVYKKLEGNSVDPTMAFTFEVTFSKALAKVPDGAKKKENTEATYIFSLVGGKEIVFDLQPGNGEVSYVVTETSAQGYEVFTKDAEGIVTSGTAAVAEFINTRNTTGKLALTKKVVNDSSDREFLFIVELSDKGINGPYGDMHFAEGVAEFSLKGGHTKTATGLPNGVGYTVTELKDAEHNYTTTTSGNESGFIKGSTDGNETVYVTFTNTRAKQDFTFTKEWRGGREDSISWKLYKADGTLVSGVKFTKKEVSKNVWTYTAKLDGDGDYYVVEDGMQGYATMYENKGIYADKTTACYNGGKIINSKVPQTGDNANPLLWCTMLVLSLAGLMAALAAKKQKR